MFIAGYNEKTPKEIQIVLNMGMENTKWLYPDRQEEFFFEHYANFQQLKELVPPRYEHTLHLLQSYLALKNNNASAYQEFYLPAAEKFRKNKPLFSEDSFNILQPLAKTIIKDYELFFISLLVTHDYGCIFDPAKHTLASAEMCVKDFIHLGFTNDMVNMAKLIIANHSYLGDLLLGEAPFGYYEPLRKKMADYNFEQKGFDLLFLLTLIDINSLNIGSVLNDEDFQTQLKIYDRSIFTMDKSELLKFRMSRISKKINPANIDVTFNNVYLQYFFDIFNPVDSNNPNFFLRSTIRDGLIAEKFINQICQLWQKTGGQEKYDYLAFNNGGLEKNNPLLYELHKKLSLASQLYSMENCVDLENRKFLGFPFGYAKEFLEVSLQ